MMKKPIPDSKMPDSKPVWIKTRNILLPEVPVRPTCSRDIKYMSEVFVKHPDQVPPITLQHVKSKYIPLNAVEWLKAARHADADRLLGYVVECQNPQDAIMGQISSSLSPPCFDYMYLHRAIIHLEKYEYKRSEIYCMFWEDLQRTLDVLDHLDPKAQDILYETTTYVGNRIRNAVIPPKIIMWLANKEKTQQADFAKWLFSIVKIRVQNGRHPWPPQSQLDKSTGGASSKVPKKSIRGTNDRRYAIAKRNRHDNSGAKDQDQGTARARNGASKSGPGHGIATHAQGGMIDIDGPPPGLDVNALNAFLALDNRDIYSITFGHRSGVIEAMKKNDGSARFFVVISKRRKNHDV